MRRLLVLVAVLGLVTACGGGGAGEATTGPDATLTPVAATASSTTSTSSTTTTVAPTTTSALAQTTTANLSTSAQRTPLLDEAEAAGWIEYADPVGWTIWLPPQWTVEASDPGVIISAPDLAVIGVLPFDDTSDSVDSEDYLILSLADAGAAGLIVNVDFSADDIILDVNQDGNLGSYDVWGVPVQYQDGSPGWAYAYYDPNTESDLGYFFEVIDLFSTGERLRDTAEAALLTFEPEGGY
jgi:hypothetical protein